MTSTRMTWRGSTTRSRPSQIRPSHATYAASRAMDAAFARVPYRDGAWAFRPLAEDADRLEVQRELACQ